MVRSYPRHHELSSAILGRPDVLRHTTPKWLPLPLQPLQFVAELAIRCLELGVRVLEDRSVQVVLGLVPGTLAFFAYWILFVSGS